MGLFFLCLIISKLENILPAKWSKCCICENLRIFDPHKHNNTMATFNIRKSYEGFPSKTNNNYESYDNIESAQHAIRFTAERWTRNGGLIVEQTPNKVVVEEADGSNTITFEIYETE